MGDETGRLFELIWTPSVMLFTTESFDDGTISQGWSKKGSTDSSDRS